MPENNPCQELFDKAVKLEEQYNLKDAQSRLPASVKKVEDVKREDAIILNNELMENMKEARKEAEKLKPQVSDAWKKYHSCMRSQTK